MKSLRLPEGKYISFIQDISGRKKDEEKLKESEERYKLAFKTSPDAVNINSLDGTYVDINDSFTKIMGYTREDVIGRKSLDLDIWANPKDREKLVEGLKVYGSYDNLDSQFQAKDGRLLTGLMSACIIPLNGVPHILSITRDITERKELERDLLKAKEKAEESDRLKTEFLNNMSHEVRTPLNAITGFAGMLAEKSVSDDDKNRFRAIISQSSEQLLTIISDIIDISRIDSKQITLNITDFDLHQVLNNIYNTYRNRESDLLKLAITGHKLSGRLMIRSDKNRLIQILSNLIDNAWKYTLEGEISFGYQLSPGNEITFYVNDTGIGIPGEHLENIFDRFRQVHLSGDKANSGTGLGLSIARGLVELLGGKITAKSIPGEGSSFSFTVPYIKGYLNNAEPVKEAEPLKNSPGEILVLVAEDDDASYYYLSQVLGRFNCEVIRASTGVEAVETVRNNPALNLVLMDIKMPVMNGYDAVREIRKFNTSINIVAQTAYAMKEDFSRAIEAGCNDYIAKPIRETELQKIMEKLVGGEM
ncbi:MAG: ATP-binding protein [Bacteroidales bacterium]